VKRRGLNREERALWQAAMRGVTPLAAVEGAAAPPDAAPPPAAKPVAAPTEPPPPRRAAKRAPPTPPPAEPGRGVDRATAERLKRGRRAIEARLDLHGLTQDEAHRALDGFLARTQAADQRCILVITGRSGVLRAAVPRWLDEAPSRARVLAIAAAQPRDGGAGALYVLLRRRR
jgi:DNA-nicking Smr family endonuclease